MNGQTSLMSGVGSLNRGSGSGPALLVFTRAQDNGVALRLTPLGASSETTLETSERAPRNLAG